MRNAAKEELRKVEELEYGLSIEKFLHTQFIKIGIVVGILMGVLGIFAIYEGIELSRYKTQEYQMSQQMQAVISVIVIGVIVVAGILLVDILLNRIALKTIGRIGNSVQVMDEAMGRLADGNLKGEITYKGNDEFSNMMANAGKAMHELKKYVNDISQSLQQMSDKNFNIGIEENYIGDFAEIRTSMLSIIDSLNVTMFEMRSSFTQVRDGADSLAMTAQSMADGAEPAGKIYP